VLSWLGLGLSLLVLAESCSGSDNDKQARSAGQGGGAGEGANGTGGAADSPSQGVCQSNDDCSAQHTVCNTAQHLCVECLTADDCEMADCISGSCVPVLECQNTRDDCPEGTVCVKAAGDTTGRCYECGANADCADDHRCSDHVCKVACDSDTDCVADGLLCDHAKSICVECLVSPDCPEPSNCQAGACVPDVCEPGTSICAGNAVMNCQAEGAGYDAPVACVDSSCMVRGDRAACTKPSEGEGGSGGSNGNGGDGNTGDACPSDPQKTEPGNCGCGFPEQGACLIHRYSFDGDSATLFDTVGSAHGTVTGGNSTQAGGVLYLGGGTGNKNYATLPPDLLKGLEDATFEAFVQWQGNGAGYLQHIFDFGSHNDTSGITYLSLTANTMAGRMRASFSINGSANEVGAESRILNSPTDLEHVAVVVNGKADTLSLYLNGAFEASAALIYPLSYINDASNYLGHSQFAAHPDLLAGILEFRIYSSARTSQQIKASREAGPDAPPSQ
jgi:hypothetical protein